MSGETLHCVKDSQRANRPSGEACWPACCSRLFDGFIIQG